MQIRGLPLTVVCVLLLSQSGACVTINDFGFPPSTKGDAGGAGGADGGPKDGSIRDAMADGEAGSCSTAPEVCNGVDDDCDGVSDAKDPDTQAYCETVVLNSTSFCSSVAKEWVCVPGDCLDGFINCDGDPSNGCEPFCSCRECPDSGADDGGSEDAGH